MQEKYTKKAFDVLQRAKEAAAKLGNEYIGTEHILLGLTLVHKNGSICKPCAPALPMWM